MTLVTDEYFVELSKNFKELLDVGPADLESNLKLHNLTLEEFNQMVDSVQEWLKKLSHVPAGTINIKQIMGFLVFQSYNVEKVKKGIDGYILSHIKMPHIMSDRNPFDPIQASYFRKGFFVVMPKKTPENCRVLIIRMVPTENFSISLLIKIVLMMGEVRVLNEISNGDRWILDLENVGFQETAQITPVLISNIINLASSILGKKLKSIHVINIPAIAAPLVNLFIRMMKSKLANRVFLANKEDLLNIFPKENLPLEYGGEGGRCQDIADKWTETLQTETWTRYFKELDDAVIDIPQKSQETPDDFIFGVDGSFRKLCVD